jgi:hypothetical protein
MTVKIGLASENCCIESPIVITVGRIVKCNGICWFLLAYYSEVTGQVILTLCTRLTFENVLYFSLFLICSFESSGNLFSES